MFKLLFRHRLPKTTYASLLFIKKINISTIVDNNNNKRCASRKMRAQVFAKHNNNSFSGNCFVCKIPIEFTEQWQCAHIVAYSKGGKTTLDNLVPTCVKCNQDMGTMNLLDYKKIYGKK